MRSKLTLFAAICVAALALGTPASATTILIFGQTATTDFVAASVVASPSSTTLSTHGPAANPTLIPISITLEGTSTMPITAFESFTALTSTASNTATPPFQVGFSGTINIWANPNGTGNILTAVITNGSLNANGAAGGFNASSGSSNAAGPVTVTLTSADPNIAPLLTPNGGPTPGAVSLSFSNISPPQNGAGFSSWTAQNSGVFSTVAAVPEPASFISAGTAILAGFGCFGWARRKSSQA